MPELIPSLVDVTNPHLLQVLQTKLDQKTKPIGALGALEALALQLGHILGTEMPNLEQPQLVVFAGDHGLAVRGVSAYPSDVTWQMVENFLTGGACVSVLARQHGLSLSVVDCGVRHDFVTPGGGEQRAGLWVRKLGQGTADASQGPAMTREQLERGIHHGRELVRQLPGNALLLGEMGIGNTSAASLIQARLTGVDIADCTGSGTGLAAAGVRRKLGILREVLHFHADVTAPLDVLQAFGGFEMATMLGAVLEAAEQRRVIVVDGFITTAVIAVAHALQPHVLQRCVFAHQSAEAGHVRLLQHLQATPLLGMGLRLGEGSGAALAWPLLQSACVMLREMASFASAGVSEKSA